MIKSFTCLALLCSCVIAQEQTSQPPAAPPPISGKLGKPIQIFNGKDFDGWVWTAKAPKPPATAPEVKLGEVWTISDGVLHCTGKPAGYIRTEKPYNNYVLTVEQRHLGKGNGGVLIAISGPDKVWPKTIEVQGQDSKEGDLWLQGGYKFKSESTTTPSSTTQRGKYIAKSGLPAAKPLGEWDTMEITVDHGNLTVKVNGQVQNVITDIENLNGPIGIQSEGGVMEFRKIQLTPIEEINSMNPTRIHKVLEAAGSVIFPGVYDTLSAKIVERVGFKMSFISGYSVAATHIGEPDLGLLTQTEIVERARQICGSVSIPIIVDADTGYGNPLNVIRTVNELIAAGAAGCFLEDQVWPKKCGHMRGKKVIERQEYIDKIRAAVEARNDRDFFIVARTDALAAVSLDEAISRVQAAREAGADASFVEAPVSLQQMAEIGQRAPKPIVANMIERGKTPLLSREQLAQMGFQLIVYPLCGIFAAAKALEEVYEKLHRDQTTQGIGERMMNFDEFNELIGVEDKYKVAERFGVRD